MMKKRILFILTCSTLICSACGMNHSMITTVKEENISETDIQTTLENKVDVTDDTITITPTSDTAEKEILHFVDAHGEWHEMIINPDVRTHNYNWNYLTNDETGISYEGDNNYTISKGVDVSYYQGTIDWEKVKADGYDFAILRIGYRGYGESGSLNMDDCFYTNIENAQKAGLDVGVYFFAQAINEHEALEEAEFVLDALEGYSLQLPVVYDPELIRDDAARTDHVTGEQFTKNTIVFCERIKEAGFEPMVYSNLVWESELFDMKQLENYPIWYADYETVPQTPYDFSIWQYTENGTVNGIEGKADLNIRFCPVD